MRVINCKTLLEFALQLSVTTNGLPMKTTIRISCALVALFLLSGCASYFEYKYNHLQREQRQKCLGKTSPTAHDECMRGMDKPYPAYKKERDDIINN